jgi:hypothetical protein
MTPIEIDQQTYYARLNTPYNPPENGVDDEFELEHASIYSLLDALLEQRGMNDPYGEGDYFLDSYVSATRGIGFEVSQDAFVTHDLLVDIQKMLKANGPSWEIFIQSQAFEWALFVNADSVLLYRSSKESLSSLA